VGDDKRLAANILKSRTLKFDGYAYISNNFSLGNMLMKTIKVYEDLNNDK
jgi:hypothetical protein